MAARTPLHPDASHSLALAMVASSEAPLLLLDGDLTVVAASASFCRSFQIDPANVSDRSIFALGEGEWGTRKLRSLLAATRSGKADIAAYEMDLERPGRDPRKLSISARKLEFGDADNARLLVTVSDITDARIAERLRTICCGKRPYCSRRVSTGSPTACRL